VGNKLGWIIAGAMLSVFVILIVTLVLWPEGPTPPTRATTMPGRLDKKTIDVPISKIVDQVPSQSGNAGDDYAEAATLYEKRKEELLSALSEANGNIANLPAEGVNILESIHENVSRGARKKDMRFTTVHNDKTFLMTHQLLGALRLQRVGTALNKLGQYYIATGKMNKAREMYEDYFLLGWHMINERSRYHMVTSGVGNQREAIRGLATVAKDAGDQAKLDTLQKYADQMDALSDFYRMKLKFIWKAQPRKYAGDVFNIAQNDEDRAWRAEAILFLGVLKYTQGHEPDLELIAEMLDKYTKSDDPYIRTAAQSATDFPITEFRRLDAIEVE